MARSIRTDSDKQAMTPLSIKVDAKRSQRRRRSHDPERQRDPARTRLLILEAANEEFARNGYEGARVVRIAERAGVAHQLIAYHFGGKRAPSMRSVNAGSRRVEVLSTAKSL